MFDGARVQTSLSAFTPHDTHRGDLWGRVELLPTWGTTMNDNLVRHFQFAGALNYFLTDVLAVGIEGQYYVEDLREPFDLVARQGAWRVLPQRDKYGLIRFQESAGTLREWAREVSNRALGEFLHTLLRIVHADAFTEWWRLDLSAAARRMAWRAA